MWWLVCTLPLVLPWLQDEKCREDKCTTGATCSGCVTLPARNETALKIAVGNIGPISVGIDASHESFQVFIGSGARFRMVVCVLYSTLWHVYFIVCVYCTHLPPLPSLPPPPLSLPSLPPSVVQERSVRPKAMQQDPIGPWCAGNWVWN